MENGTAKRISLTAIPSAIFIALITVNAEFIAKQIGADAWGYKALILVGAKMDHPAVQLTLLLSAAVATGPALYLWSDFLWRKWRERWQLTERLSFGVRDRKLVAMTLMLFFGGGFALSALWVAGERFLAKPPIEQKQVSQPGATLIEVPTTQNKVSGNPLQDAIDSFLAKQGSQARYNPTNFNVQMGDESDGRGPFIASWDVLSLGSWPDLADGFTINQLRRSPTLRISSFPKGSEDDVKKKLPVLDSIIDIVSDDMVPLFDEGRRLQTNWWNGLKDKASHPNYNADLSRFRDAIQSNHDKLNKIREKNQKFSDIQRLLDQRYYDALFKNAEAFMIQFGTLHNYMNMENAQYDRLDRLMRPLYDSFERSLNDYNQWVKETKSAAIQRRQQLAESTAQAETHAHAMVSAAESTKKKPPYLPSYADYMSVQLRQIRNVITESVRDSTSLPGYFQNWSRHRRQFGVFPNPPNPLANEEIAELQNKLSELVKFYADIESALTATLTKDRSYMQDLSPFTEPASISEDYRNLLGDFQKFIALFATNEGRLDSGAADLIQGYADKVAFKYSEQWKRSTASLGAIDTKLSDLNQNR